MPIWVFLLQENAKCLNLEQVMKLLKSIFTFQFCKGPRRNLVLGYIIVTQVIFILLKVKT